MGTFDLVRAVELPGVFSHTVDVLAFLAAARASRLFTFLG
jgi:hypothetical protein